MNTNQDNPNSSKKSLFLNIAKILALAAVALIIFLLARSCSSNRTELEITSNAMLRERDSVNNEIRKIRDNFSLLNNEKDNLTQALEKESTANKQLEFEKAAKNTQLRLQMQRLLSRKRR